MNENPKQRLKEWQDLPEPKPSWETFKRMRLTAGSIERWRKLKKEVDSKGIDAIMP